MCDVEDLPEKGITAAPRFYWGCCMVCRQVGSPSSPLKRCSRCRCMYYCSTNHQKQDWKTHKHLCSKIVSLCQLTSTNDMYGDGFEYKSCPKLWLDFRIRLASTFEGLLQRKLHDWERDLILYPKVCRLCFQRGLHGMVDCTKCMCVSYCSEQHKQEHAADHELYCNELMFAMTADNYEYTVEIARPPLPEQLDTTFIPVGGEIKTYLLSQLGLNPKDVLDELQFRFLTDRLSPPLTILYAANMHGLGNNKLLDYCKDLVIHIVGANREEMIGFIKWEYLAHRLPVLCHLHIVFVGLELTMERDGICDYIENCNECQVMSRNLVYEIRGGTYKDYVGSIHYTPPDFVCAFNCGFHEHDGMATDTWRESLACLVQHDNVPLLFTSYTYKEAQDDLKCLENACALSSYCIEALTRCEANPFRGHHPSRDPDCPPNPDVFYKNQFLSVAKRIPQM